MGSLGFIFPWVSWKTSNISASLFFSITLEMETICKLIEGIFLFLLTRPQRHNPTIIVFLFSLSVQTCLHSLRRHTQQAVLKLHINSPYLCALCGSLCEVVLKHISFPLYSNRDRGWVPVLRLWTVAMTSWFPRLWPITQTHCHVALQNKTLPSTTASPKPCRRA